MTTISSQPQSTANSQQPPAIPNIHQQFWILHDHVRTLSGLHCLNSCFSFQSILGHLCLSFQSFWELATNYSPSSTLRRSLSWSNQSQSRRSASQTRRGVSLTSTWIRTSERSVRCWSPSGNTNANETIFAFSLCLSRLRYFQILNLIQTQILRMIPATNISPHPSFLVPCMRSNIKRLPSVMIPSSNGYEPTTTFSGKLPQSLASYATDHTCQLPPFSPSSNPSPYQILHEDTYATIWANSFIASFA